MSFAWDVYLPLVLGFLFLAAGLSKLWDRRAFQQAVAGYQILPPGLAPAAALLIPTLESTGGALLVTGISVPAGSILLAILLVVFDAALIVNLARRRRNLDCGCFGRRTSRIGWGNVVQNTVLLVAVLYLVASAEIAPPGVDASSWFLTMLAALYTVVAFLSAQELLAVRAGLVRLLSCVKTE